MKNEKVAAILSYLHDNYDDAKTALDFSNDYECLVSIILSAQTTDKSVNKVTPALFKHFPDFESLGKASIEEIENDIKTLGLYHNKAKSINALGKVMASDYNSVIPGDKKTLTSLPGVGIKTAGVFLLERRGEQVIPVDTHVRRIAIRLGFAGENDEFSAIERKLEKAFPYEEHSFVHHSFINFGRTKCSAQRPACEGCPLAVYCKYSSSTKGKKSKRG
ncbi:MAG: endonuclease III [Bacilli bacterium]|nr:endonuclease III [Bacilli bacterium]